MVSGFNEEEKGGMGRRIWVGFGFGKERVKWEEEIWVGFGLVGGGGGRHVGFEEDDFFFLSYLGIFILFLKF